MQVHHQNTHIQISNSESPETQQINIYNQDNQLETQMSFKKLPQLDINGGGDFNHKYKKSLTYEEVQKLGGNNSNIISGQQEFQELHQMSKAMSRNRVNSLNAEENYQIQNIRISSIGKPTDQSMPLNNNPQNSILNSLIYECEDQRNQFTIKYQAALNYMLKRIDEQEQIIQNLTQKLQKHEKTQEINNLDDQIDTFKQQNIQKLGIKNQKRMSDPQSFRSSYQKVEGILHLGASQTLNTINEQSSKDFQNQEDADHFERLQGDIKNQVSNKTLLFPQEKVQSQKPQIFNEIDASDFILQLKQQLFTCQKIIKKDKEDKLKLIFKLKDMQQEIQQLKQSSSQKNQRLDTEQSVNDSGNKPSIYNSPETQTTRDLKAEKLNVKIQTDIIPEQTFMTEQTINRTSVGINTSNFLDDEVKDTQNFDNQLVSSTSVHHQSVKVMFDEFEESRLKENVNFWKEKVDLLLQEKKEQLHEQMTQHKLIRNYESQIEELKCQMRQKDYLIECFQLEKKITSSRNEEIMEDHNLLVEPDIADYDNLESYRKFIEGTGSIDQRESVLSDIKQESMDKQQIRVMTQHDHQIISYGITNHSDVSNEYQVQSSNNNSDLPHEQKQYPIDTQIQHYIHNINSQNVLLPKNMKSSNYNSMHSNIAKRKISPKKGDSRIRVSKLTTNGNLENNSAEKQQQSFIDQQLQKQKNYDIVNRTGLNQLNQKFHRLQSGSHQYKPVRESVYQNALIKHQRQISNNLAPIRSFSRDHSNSALRFVGSQNESETQLSVQNDIRNSSRKPIVKDNVSQQKQAKQMSKIQNMQSNSSTTKKSQQRNLKSSQSKSRTDSNSNKKISRSFKGSNIGNKSTLKTFDQVQIIEDSKNMNLIENIIQTISKQSNKAIQEVYEKTSVDETFGDNRSLGSQSSMTIDRSQTSSTNLRQYQSPMSHAQSILNAYKLQQPLSKSKPQDLAANIQKSLQQQKQMMNSFTESDRTFSKLEQRSTKNRQILNGSYIRDKSQSSIKNAPKHNYRSNMQQNMSSNQIPTRNQINKDLNIEEEITAIHESQQNQHKSHNFQSQQNLDLSNKKTLNNISQSIYQQQQLQNNQQNTSNILQTQASNSTSTSLRMKNQNLENYMNQPPPPLYQSQSDNINLNQNQTQSNDSLKQHINTYLSEMETQNLKNTAKFTNNTQNQSVLAARQLRQNFNRIMGSQNTAEEYQKLLEQMDYQQITQQQQQQQQFYQQQELHERAFMEQSQQYIQNSNNNFNEQDLRTHQQLLEQQLELQIQQMLMLQSSNQSSLSPNSFYQHNLLQQPQQQFNVSGNAQIIFNNNSNSNSSMSLASPHTNMIMTGTNSNMNIHQNTIKPLTQNPQMQKQNISNSGNLNQKAKNHIISSHNIINSASGNVNFKNQSSNNNHIATAHKSQQQFSYMGSKQGGGSQMSNNQNRNNTTGKIKLQQREE
eukprot:403342633